MTPKGMFNYLMLNPNQKIQYKANTGMGIKDIYDSMVKPIEGEFIRKSQLYNHLNISRNLGSRLLNGGVFGEKTKNSGRSPISVKSVNPVIKLDQKRIPISEFYDILKDHYISKDRFRKLYRTKFEKGIISSKRRYFNLVNAAKIASYLTKRKDIIENWHTIRDLHAASELELKTKQIQNRYWNMIKEGK